MGNNRYYFLTIFPQLIEHYLSFGLIGKAGKKGLFQASVYDLRQFAENKALSVDDRVYGGGPGMVFRPQPLARGIRAIEEKEPELRIIYPSPSGTPFTHADAERLLGYKAILFLCGRYEGIDERIIDHYVDEEISIGDFVLSGGELPALAIFEASVRFIPELIGHADATVEESFADGLLEYPHYTRPEEFEGMRVPDILLSGNHAEIQKWRQKMARQRTALRRPDLLAKKQSPR